jgi:hypothetical protein
MPERAFEVETASVALNVLLPVETKPLTSKPG